MAQRLAALVPIDEEADGLRHHQRQQHEADQLADQAPGPEAARPQAADVHHAGDTSAEKL
jgi:hypothetical protein